MEAARGEAAEHRVADGADTRLDRARILRQTAGGDLLLEEFDDVHADGPGRLGIGLELLRLVTTKAPAMFLRWEGSSSRGS